MDTPIENSMPVRGSHAVMRWVVALVVLLAAILVGYFLGSMASQQAYERGVADGREQARSLIAEIGLLPNPSTNGLSGEVTAISGDRIELQVGQVVVNPLEQPAPETRTVIVDSDTLVEISTQLSNEEIDTAFETYRNEFDAWVIATEAGEDLGDPPEPPNPASSRSGSLEDIEIGDSIRVHADTDIALASEFTVISVEILESQPQPPGPPPSEEQ